MSEVKLKSKNGMLYTPAENVVNPEVTHWNGEGEDLLLIYYSNGEPDTVYWKDSRLWKGELDKTGLAAALFDARETGTIPDVREVELPDGETFAIDFDYDMDKIPELTYLEEKLIHEFPDPNDWSGRNYDDE